MLRHRRFSVLIAAVLAVLALGLSGCSDDDPKGEPTPTFETPSAEASDPGESCQAIAGSGAVEDVQELFDKYKNNSQPLSPADEKKMRDALDRLAKAGDNAAPKIREDVVTLVASIGSQIDQRAGIPGTGKVTDTAEIERQLDALCR